MDRTRIGPEVTRLLKAVTRNGVKIDLILEKRVRRVKNTFQMLITTGGPVEPPHDRTRQEVTRSDLEQ